MKLLSLPYLLLGLYLAGNTVAQTTPPTFVPEIIAELPLSEATISRLTVGLDGRLYGHPDARVDTLWSIGRDKANPDFRVIKNPSLNPRGSNTVRGRTGAFYRVSNPVGEARSESDSIYKGCPYFYTVEQGGAVTPHEKFASVVKFGPDLVMEKIPVSESQPFCSQLSDLAIDAEDNLYFFSQINRVNLPSNQSAVGTHLYKLSADGNSLQRLRTFTEAEGLKPNSLIVSHDGQWLYGTSRRQGRDFGFLYRIRVDGSGYEKIHTFSTETGLQENGGNDPLIELDGYLYLAFKSGGPGRRGALMRIRPDGSDPLYFFSFTDRETHGGSPTGSLAVIDGEIYGVGSWGGTHGKGMLYRITPSAITGPSTGVDILHHFSFGLLPSGLVAGPDGKLYGSTNKSSFRDPVVLYSIDVGYIPPGPVLTLQANPTQVAWRNGMAEPATLSWTSENAATCQLQGPGLNTTPVPTSGSWDVTPTAEGENLYTLTCDSGTGKEGSTASESIVIRAVPVAAPVAIDTFSVSVTQAQPRQTVRFSWTTRDALTCTGSWSGSPLPIDQLASGSMEHTLGLSEGEQTYTLTCTGRGGDTASKDVTLTVKATGTDGEAPGMNVGSSGGPISPWLLLALPWLAIRSRRSPRH